MALDILDPTQTAIAKETGALNNLATSLQKSEPGATWKANEIHVVPKNRISIVVFALMVCFFRTRLSQSFNRKGSCLHCWPCWIRFVAFTIIAR
jgi:hypothetical protein